ncbi:hypothetical protein Tsubulata_013443 [Turnera subulata]|uniref:Uncharacterized protein n=1 Tax=Turnera subulata TaxID=218843 RepID=A0A9Q0JCJ1_9ROSI|nr:hypothetical protein Tsubulata_013443 [Turnera subulata]
MSDSLSALQNYLFQFSNRLLDLLSKTHCTPPEDTPISIKSTIQSLFSPPQNPNGITETQLFDSIKSFALGCALLSSSQSSTHELLSWVPTHFSNLVNSAFTEFSRAYVASGCFGERNERRVCEILGLHECGEVRAEERLVVELFPEVLPVLKERIKESSIDKNTDGDEVSAASARVPVGLAVVAACQFRWFVTQVDKPRLGKLSALVIPCGLTALDHWSPDVKGQGMICFIHLAKNVNEREFGGYGEVILDACCQNIACSDEIWHDVVEMSVLLVTSIQRNNPRSSWFERILNEMLGHLERQPRNKDRRIAWLTFIEPLFHAVGLVLLAHFRRLFPLFFVWMHADDDETVLLVLQRVHAVMRLTWIRNTPYLERLVDELVILYKESALKVAREEIRTTVLEILVLLRQCQSVQFEAAWDKHKNDPNLEKLSSSMGENTANNVGSYAEKLHGGGGPSMGSTTLQT